MLGKRRHAEEGAGFCSVMRVCPDMTNGATSYQFHQVFTRLAGLTWSRTLKPTSGLVALCRLWSMCPGGHVCPVWMVVLP
jgi:hypothetical protein